MNLRIFTQKAKSRAARMVLKLANREAFDNDFLRNIPVELRPAAEWIYHGKSTAAEKKIADLVEGFRQSMKRDEGNALSFSSPHSGDFSRDDTGRAKPGVYESSTIAEHSQTGVRSRGGILLRRLVSGLKANRVLELGTNTGFSGCYILSADQSPELVTVEGSPDLCSIAKNNLAKVSANYTIINSLFDDAIDALISKSEKFDMIFNDGQHESGAVLHYLERCMPLIAEGGCFIFDDIYWSDDMNHGWKRIVGDSRFSTTFDFSEKGIAILGDGNQAVHHYFDICEYIGRPSILRKGW